MTAPQMTPFPGIILRSFFLSGIAAREMWAAAPEMGLALRLEILFLEIIQRYGLQMSPAVYETNFPLVPWGEGAKGR